MPYNTRRKSLSLPSLGIHLPVSHASRAAARSPPSATPTEPPPKKIKRSHSSTSPSPMSPPARREAKSTIKYENTPPPSPEAEAVELDDCPVKREIDLEGINDDIVEGVIIQLQKTANRPHLVKELAAVLSGSVKIVETSANPSAIISSRLSTYLKRPCWTALAPCPIAKELETVHPRRTYFYLTTYAHQPIPDPASVTAASEALRFPQRTIISPSLSSAASRSDEADAERRRELSPSPEVDLSTHDFDDVEDVDLVGTIAPPTPTGSFAGRPLLPHQHSNHPDHRSESAGLVRNNHRANSPPLEKDEKEFTQAAQGMQRRQMSQVGGMGGDALMRDVSTGRPSGAQGEEREGEEMEGEGVYNLSKHMDIDVELFGGDAGNTRGQGLSVASAGAVVFASSPAMKPLVVTTTMAGNNTSHGRRLTDESTTTGLWARIDDQQLQQLEWDTRSPENIELDELDGLLDDF